MRSALAIALLASAGCATQGGPAPSDPKGQVSSAPETARLSGQLVHVGGKPAADVCIVLGPTPTNCAATSDESGAFTVTVPRDAVVNWTVHYFVDGQELGLATVSGPFDVDTVTLPTWTLP